MVVRVGIHSVEIFPNHHKADHHLEYADYVIGKSGKSREANYQNSMRINLGKSGEAFRPSS